jgi:hypothetical protein
MKLVSSGRNEDSGEGLTVEEVNTSDVPPHVLSNLGSHGSDGLVELLLDDHIVKESGEKDFLVLRGIGVVGTRLARDEGVELSKHEAEGRAEERRRVEVSSDDTQGGREE